MVRWTWSCFILLTLLIAFPGGANAVLGGEDRAKCQKAFDGIQKELQEEALSAFNNSKSLSHTTFTNFSMQYQIFMEKAVWYRLCEGQPVLAADWLNENDEGVVFEGVVFQRSGDPHSRIVHEDIDSPRLGHHLGHPH